MYAPKLKDSFLVPSGPNGFHLHVVVTPACIAGFHILIGISSIKGCSRQNDLSCTIAPGEHGSITKPSFAFYKNARHDSAIHLGRCVGEDWPLQDPVSDALLDRLVAGITISEHTKPFILKCLETKCSN